MFISYKELSAYVPSALKRHEGKESNRTRSTHRHRKAFLPMTALLHTSKGAAADSNSNESSRTDTKDRDWFPEYYPSSYLFVLCIYSTERISYTYYDDYIK